MAKAKPEISDRAQSDLDLLLTYRRLFSTSDGVTVLADLVKRHQHRSSMHDSPTRMAFMEGERNVVLMLLTALNIDEDKLKERVNNVKGTQA